MNYGRRILYATLSTRTLLSVLATGVNADNQASKQVKKGWCKVIRRVGSISVVLLLAVLSASAQNGPQYKQPEDGVPVLTGFVGLGTDFQPGQQQVLPIISPMATQMRRGPE